MCKGENEQKNLQELKLKKQKLTKIKKNKVIGKKLTFRNQKVIFFMKSKIIIYFIIFVSKL